MIKYKRGSKIIALSLSLILIFTFSFPLDINAVATETIIIGGILAAFLTACGLRYTNSGVSSDIILQGLYDTFTTWLADVKQMDDIAQILAGISIYKGYCKITDTISNLFSEFAVDYNAENVSGDTIYSESGLYINGALMPVRKFRSRDLPGTFVNKFRYNTDYQIIFADESAHVIKVTWDSENLSTNVYVDAIKENFSTLQASGASQTSNEYFEFYVDTETNTIGILQLVKWGRSSDRITRLSSDLTAIISDAEISIDNNISTTPQETLLDGESTYLTPTVPNAKTLSDYVGGVSQRLAANALEQDFINGDNTLIDDTIPSTITGQVSIVGDVTIADSDLPDIDGITWGDIPTMLTTVFPFSIPWDVKKGIQAVQAEPVPPVWTITFPDVAGYDTETEITIDLTTDLWTRVFGFLRWAQIILWCAGLAAASSKLIWGSD